MIRKICVVTGGRADYGLLYWLMKEVQSIAGLRLQVIATGSHLSPEFGSTWRAIVDDGFVIDATVEMLLSSDTPVGIAKSIGLGVIGFADALDRLKPDILVLLGDRFEILAAAQAAMVAAIPLAHIGGGDYGEATHDNITRHCITKMAHLHFVTHAAAHDRVIQLGERRDSVFDVGSLAVDGLKHLSLLSTEALQEQLDMDLSAPYVVVTYHPTNLEQADPGGEFRELLDALALLQGEGLSVIFTMPNADNHGRILRRMIDQYVESHRHAHAFESLGARRYLSLVNTARAVVGNSSSGIYEAPLYRTPTVDIGNRQRGRARGASVLTVEGKADAIFAAVKRCLAGGMSFDDYPYGNDCCAPAIARRLAEVSLDGIVYKQFCDIKVPCVS